jgi:Protein of unknown function (DUF1629)
MSPRKARPPVFYTMNWDLRSWPIGWKFLNYDTLQAGHRGIYRPDPWPDGYLQLPRGPWTLPEFVEPPRFLIDSTLGRPVKDLENYDGFFFISPALKAILQMLDPSACQFRVCETVLPSGEPGPELWLCSVTRAFAGAVDVDNSEDVVVGQGSNGLPRLIIWPGSMLRFRADVIGNAHLFRIAESFSPVYCDQMVKDACKAGGLKGIEFRSVTKR